MQSHLLLEAKGASFFLFFFFCKDFFRERGREGKREGEKHQLVASLMCPNQGPTTQACALTRNQISDLLFCGTTPIQLRHTSQGQGCLFLHMQEHAAERKDVL